MGKVMALIGPYMPLVLTFVCLITAWRFGDWRNWKKYYPTILTVFLIMYFQIPISKMK
ncbi:hypothetical protein SAMN04487897_102812 [Paenibacillus sp. yr247]|nr:hypothetical protein SAMN04487897_102812 [Paenibacillus sp. yr247]